MDSSVSGSRFSSATHSPIKFKHCMSELKRQGLERLLCAVYQRDVTLDQLLKEGGASQAVLDVLRQKNLSSLSDHLIREVKDLVSNGDGADRRYQIIERFYGLDGNMPARLSAMATKHGVSRERIRQIKERSLMSLRYKKASLEKLLFHLSMRLLARRSSDNSGAKTPAVSEIDDFKLFTHRQLLLMHESQYSMTEEQSQILFDINWAKRMRIAGCAGSGKTALAMMMARKLASEGKRTLLTCFNRSLAHHMAELLEGEKNLLVTSFHALCLRFGKQAGITIPGGWNSRAWLERFPELLRKAVLANPDLKFDAIIVDDGHEIRDIWWSALEATLCDSPQTRLYYFVDDNQWKSALAKKYPDVDLISHLSINLRTPAMISSYLKASYAGKNPMRFARLTSAPAEFFSCETDNEIQLTLTHVIQNLVDSGVYRASDIAILTPRLPSNSAVTGTRLKGSTRIVKRPSDVPNHAILNRCHTFQGLERRVVIIIDLDDRFAELSADEIRTFVYMTFTRFVDKLFILGSNSAWRRIESITEPRYTAPPSVAPRAQWLERPMERL